MELEARLNEALSDRYRITGEIGRGGMATVFLAEDLKHRRPVAIKVLRPELSASMGTDRFLREIEVVAGLNHPNILGLHDSGEADGLLFFVMPYVDGETLRARLDRQSRLPLDDAVRITREVGEALHYAHQHGLVHRDVKPENVLFQAGHALVCDFGISRATDEAQPRLTRTGLAVGTFSYMSPEQLTDGGGVDSRTDVYALGCLLFEMLFGEPPFAAQTPQASLARKLTGDVPYLSDLRPDVPDTLNDVLGRALAVEAKERFETPEQFVADLDRAITTEAVEEDAWRRRRKRAIRALSAMAVLVLVGLGIFRVGQVLREPPIGRVAVLPFSNTAADASQEHFAAIGHQDLIQQLVKAGSGAGLGVVNGGVVAGPDGTAMRVRDIADELNVDGVIQGYAGGNGDRVTLDLQLVDGSTEEIVWTESYQAGFGELVTMYRLATRALTSFLGLELTPEEEARLSVAQEMDPAVASALVNARFNWQKLTGEGIETAMDYYELALERSDSLSAEAWVGVATVWGARAQQQLISGLEANRMAQPALERALALDPELSRVQSLLAGRLTWAFWNWEAGEAAYLRALEEDPADSKARAYYAHLLLYLDRDDEALEQLRRADELDPYDALTQTIIAMGYNFLRRYAEAEAVLLRVLEKDPDAGLLLSTLRTTYHLMGRHEEAMEMWRGSYRASGNTAALEALERGYETGGYSGALAAVAELFVERSGTTFVSSWNIGTLYTRAGQGEKALGYLEAAFENRNPNIPYLSIDPIFDDIRDEPRFRTMIDRLGLPQ